MINKFENLLDHENFVPIILNVITISRQHCSLKYINIIAEKVPVLRALKLKKTHGFFLISCPLQVKKQHLQRDIEFLVDELKVVTRQQAEDRVFFVSAKEALITRIPKPAHTPDSSKFIVQGW